MSTQPASTNEVLGAVFFRLFDEVRSAESRNPTDLIALGGIKAFYGELILQLGTSAVEMVKDEHLSGALLQSRLEAAERGLSEALHAVVDSFRDTNAQPRARASAPSAPGGETSS